MKAATFIKIAGYARKCGGFTLIELITVMVLIGILAALGGFLILTPVQSFVDQSRRSALTDEADNALQRISRELRNALPNSIRISGTALEFLHTSTGGRYRARQDIGGTGNPLTNGASDVFDVLGGIDPTVVDASGPAGQANCLNNITDCLVIFNTGVEDPFDPADDAAFFDAYQGENIAAITGVTATTLTYDNTGVFTFPFPIPPDGNQRFFIVNTPISYVCSGNQLWRYENYPILNAQPTPAGGAAISGVNPQRLANNIALCTFSYNAGAGTRYGLVTLRVTVTDAPTGESVSLLYQTHVSNIP